ncbi:hypothetical protein [Streptomyces sp. NPDC048269]|uniref:hypothetical protein n=1 Tax=Streptomyces sp. NPDC048269 TaxID=3155753 RepID=UPI003422FFBC
MTASPDSATAPGALWRHRDFRRYLTGQTAGVAGSSITAMALPVLAVLELDATTGQVAWLVFLGQLPPALLALPAGALADRHSKRRQHLRAAFLDGHGRPLTPAEELRLDCEAAFDAVSGIAYGTSHDDPEVTERGHRTLRRLYTAHHP